MGRQTLPRAMGVSLAGLAFSPSPASLIASPRFAHAVAMRVRLISTSRRPIGTRVSDAVLLTAPGRTHKTSWPTWPHMFGSYTCPRTQMPRMRSTAARRHGLSVRRGSSSVFNCSSMLSSRMMFCMLARTPWLVPGDGGGYSIVWCVEALVLERARGSFALNADAIKLLRVREARAC